MQLLSHDQSLALMDCRQRLRGYAFVMVIGLDDLLIPLKHQNVKDLLREQLIVRGATYIYIYIYTHLYFVCGVLRA